MNLRNRATVAAASALITVGALAGCSATTDAPASAPVATSHTVAQTPVKTTAPAKPKPTKPAATVAQTQALIAAKSYLSMGSGFSEKGLYEQLTSKAGDGFKPADAKWAIAHAHADWNAQAVESAKGYLSMGGFSRASLLDQLTSSYGDGYTKAQAEYALKKVGL